MGNIGTKEKEFSRKGVDDDDNAETMQEYIIRTLKTSFIDNIPMDEIKELPPLYMYICGFILEFGVLGLFIYLVYTGYSQGLAAEFMSLSPSSGDCVPVVQPMSGTFYIDQFGNWEGQPNFVFTFAKYQFFFSHFVGTVAQFHQLLNDTYTQLVHYGRLHAANNDLAYNLILWGSFTITSLSPNNVAQRLILTGDPQFIFNRQYMSGTISNVNGDCDAPSLVTFDGANFLLELQYDLSDFSTNANCNGTVQPTYLGYNPTLDNGRFHMSIDIRSLSLALAINLGLVPLENLEIVKGSYARDFVYNETAVVGEQYVDPLVPGMDPVYCLTYIDAFTMETANLCFIQIGNAVLLPVFNQYGYNANTPSYCACGAYIPPDVEQQCSTFDLIPALLFYNIPPGTTASQMQASVVSLLELRTTLHTYDFSSLAYNATFAAASITNALANPVLQTRAWRLKAYEFCQTATFGYCNFITWHLTDNLDQSVSQYMYQLKNASCTDSIVVPYNVWSRLYEQDPPAPLEAGYYKCTPFEFDAMTNSIGIASGNIGLFVPLLCFLLLPLTYTWLKFIGFVPPKEEYDEKQKEEAVDMFITQVLRIRDNKTRGMKQMLTLKNLTKELISANKLEAGYSDSDDSDDEDPEAAGRKSTAAGAPKRGIVRKQSSRLGEGHKHHNHRINQVFLKNLEDEYTEDGGRLSFLNMMQKNPMRASHSSAPPQAQAHAGERAKEKAKHLDEVNGLSMSPMSKPKDNHIILNQSKIKRRKHSMDYDSVEGTVDEMNSLFALILKNGKSACASQYDQALALSQELQDLNDATWMRSSSIVAPLLEALILHGCIALECTQADIKRDNYKNNQAASIYYTIGGIEYGVERLAKMAKELSKYDSDS